MLDLAKVETGIEHDDSAILPALERLVDSFNRDGQPHEQGAVMLHERILRQLKNRLRLARDLSAHPEILDEPIDQPIFINGMARTGSTKTQKLLSASGDFNYLTFWNAFNPALLSGDPSESPDLRIADADAYTRWFDEQSPLTKCGHSFETHEPEEESDILGHSMMSPVWFGWAPLSPGSLAAFRRLCAPEIKVYEICGQTEAVACHRFHIDQHLDMYLREAPASNHVGKPSPIMAATVWDEQGQDLRGQQGVAGEAVYRSPAMFSGYYRDAKATEEALAGGWFHSGDSFAYHDDEVRLMVDRYKDIVKSGGENVSTIRVEAVLQQHPTVERAAVVGVADERWGEAVTACVIPRAGTTVDSEALIAFARERLAGFETPKRVVVMDEFPTTVGGKILKYKIRQALAAQD